MKYINYFLLLMLLVSCNNKIAEKNKSKRTKYESINADLLCLKNHLFIIYSEALQSDSNSKYGISKKDSCFINTFIQDVSTHQYINTSRYNLKYIYDDKNSKLLIKKWLAKNDFDFIPIENGDKVKHSFNYFKSLEFYNSKDLNDYIDSVRVVEVRNH